MTTKLNLTIEETVVSQVKKYARKKNVSVSELTENYYKSLLQEKSAKKESFTEKYAGIVKNNKLNNLNKIRDEILKEKYGL